MEYLAQQVHDIYTRVNPLDLDSYWPQVTKFLMNLHETIYTEGQEMHFSILTVDQYYFLVKMCVDFSFRVSDIITIRNQRESKSCKTIANDIAHNILPSYILTLQSTLPRLKNTVNISNMIIYEEENEEDNEDN